MENSNKNTRQEMPYSYHTFIYPFSYDTEKLSIDEQRWEEEADPGDGKLRRADGQDVPEKDLLLYNEYQYFFPQARRYIFNSSRESEHVLYSLRGLGSDNGSSYNIKVTKTENEKEIQKEYELFLNAIRLSVYPRLKIGILTFETEYYKRSFADALDINDLGRRLFPPCIAYRDQRFRSILTADEISVSISGERNYSIRFHQDEYENEQEIGFIRQILGIQKEQITIKSILDDRMFTACLIRDNTISETPFLKELHKSLDDWEQCEDGIKEVEKIYEFVYMDQEGNCTCQSRRMLEQGLKENLYDRWVNYGTFYGITEYSFVCATGEDMGCKHVINAFLTIYVDMAKMVLAQRAALTKIEDDIPEIPVQGITDTKVEEIRKIWEQYLLCQCKLCLPEVTFQQQGVGIYKMLKEAFRIDDIGSKLEEKLDNLHNVAELYYEKEEQERDKESNDQINQITIIGLPLTVGAVVLDYLLGLAGLTENKGYIAIRCFLIPFIVSIVLYVMLKNPFRRDLKKRKN